jgi:IS4 transposase
LLHHNTVFASILKFIPRRRFDRYVKRHQGDRYAKSLSTWCQFTALIYGQLSNASSLRAIAAGWNAQAQHHYHLGGGQICRSTLADANARRPADIFLDTFNDLSFGANRQLRRDAGPIIRLIDSSPIPVSKLCAWATSNGRTSGLKLHVVYDPIADHPRIADISPANVNDVTVGRETTMEPGAIYVFDKAYSDYRWWRAMHEAGSTFVTRPKSNVKFKVLKTDPLEPHSGDGFTVIKSEIVEHETRSHVRLTMPLRRITIRRHQDKKVLVVITNDITASSDEIASLYKMRWQIELLFRWIKQHLKVRNFLGRSENAIRIQVLVAMIVYLLLRLAAKGEGVNLLPLRFAELVGACLFERKTITHIDKPPERAHRYYTHPHQLSLNYV